MKDQFIIFFFIPAILILFSCQENQEKYDPGKTMGALHISKEKPQPGDNLVITYQWETETDEKDPEAFFHYFVGPELYPQDFDLTESSGKWQGRIVIPDSATAVAINISRNGNVDHNSRNGFVLQLYDKEGELIPGSNASTGYFYYRLNSQYEVANDSSFVLIKKDLEKFPQLKKDWDRAYSTMLNSSNQAEARKYIDERIQDYAKEKLHDKKALSNLVVFHNILRNKEMSDSLQQVMVERFPMGKTAQRRYLDQFFQASDLSKKEEVFEEYQNLFGKDYNSSDKDNMLMSLADAYAGQQDWETFKRYSIQISENFLKGFFYNHFAKGLAEKDKDLDRAAKLSRMSLEFLNNTDKKEKPVFFTQKQHERRLEILKRTCADTYALIMYKQGDTRQALNYQKEAVGEGENSQHNERYLEYLIASGDHEKAYIEAAGFIKANSANARIKKYYKKAYINYKGSTKGLEESLAQLEKTGYEKAKRDLLKKMLDEEAPDFRLADLDGNEMILSSLMGKIVILDFWATWCKPCLDAFPGMQIAVDKYKDDGDVVFLFVNTFESGENLNTKIRELLTINNYSFQVVMDRDTEEGVKYKTAKDYNVSAIPTKIIIGPDGRLKFKNLGSWNSEELGVMIDILNNYNKSTPEKSTT